MRATAPPAPVSIEQALQVSEPKGLCRAFDGPITWRSRINPPAVQCHCHPEAPAYAAISLPTVATASPLQLGKERGLTCPPTFYLPEARENQMAPAAPDVPALNMPTWRGGARNGADPHVPAPQASCGLRGLKSDQRKNSAMSCFICVRDQAALPSSRVMASFPLVYFSHCKFLVQTQRGKKFKKKVLLKKRLDG